MDTPEKARYRDYFGAAPFEDVVVGVFGDISLCSCAAWLPTPSGRLSVESWQECWNAPAAQAIRESIHDETFSYCHDKFCPHLVSLSGNVRRRESFKLPEH